MSRLVPTVGFIAILCSLGCQTAENPLLGVWQVQVIENRSGDSSTENSSPLPSLAIFTPTHYSFTWMPGVSAMRSFKEPWSPTAEEKIQRYGEIIVNSGAYTLAASTLTLRPLVSRIPEFT